MKKTLIIPAALVIFIFLLIRHNNDPGVIIGDLIKNNKPVKGKLVYTANFLNLIPLGEAELFLPQAELYQGLRVWHLAAQANTLKIFSGFFKARAILDSYVDEKSSNPVFFKQIIALTGKGELKKEVFYDQQKEVMTINAIERKILTDTQDPLSAIFNLRKMDFSEVKNFEISLNTNQKNYVLKGRVNLRRININNQRCNIAVVHADISRRDKNPYHKSEVTMVLWQDRDNLPLTIKVFASGALVNARLTDIR
ncbi:MAG: DUF3108 domain-containing protein [Candidatus Omnitrophica bacterium]|nr:DUF3108 domain-containing protein [Candidatus Omnitrophota bacterium]